MHRYALKQTGETVGITRDKFIDRCAAVDVEHDERANHSFAIFGEQWTTDRHRRAPLPPQIHLLTRNAATHRHCLRHWSRVHDCFLLGLFIEAESPRLPSSRLHKSKAIGDTQQRLALTKGHSALLFQHKLRR